MVLLECVKIELVKTERQIRMSEDGSEILEDGEKATMVIFLMICYIILLEKSSYLMLDKLKKENYTPPLITLLPPFHFIPKLRFSLAALIH